MVAGLSLFWGEKRPYLMEQGEDMDRIIILLSQSAEAKKKPLSCIEKGEMFYVSFRVF